jgi:N-acetylglutamate synthase-like GNAT family acetyltransferase
VSVELGWWFPERPAAEPELGGVWEANANVLTSADVARCDPILGQWPFRGIPCRVSRAVDVEKAVVRQASAKDAAALTALLAADDMECPDIPAEEFSILVDDEEILSAIRLEDDGDRVMVRPLVVAARHRGQGLGRHLLERVLPGDRPTILVARGRAVGFYSRAGFSDAPWESVPERQRDECAACPERRACDPRPMASHPDRAPAHDAWQRGQVAPAIHPTSLSEAGAQAPEERS